MNHPAFHHRGSGSTTELTHALSTIPRPRYGSRWSHESVFWRNRVLNLPISVTNHLHRAEGGPVSHFEGVPVSDGLTDAAGLALEPGLGVASKIGRMPAMSGVSISPKVFLTGRVLRFLVGVQRSDATPPMRILESREAASVSTTRTTLPGLK